MPDYVFSRKRDGTFQLESCDSPDANLFIPAEYEGRPVTSIAENAFSWCYQIRRAVIPDSVTSIGEGAFSWCESLEEIVIPDSVRTIEDWAFTGCQSLRSIRLPDGIRKI